MGMDLIKHGEFIRNENHSKYWNDKISDNFPYLNKSKKGVYYSQLIKVKPNTKYKISLQGGSIELRLSNWYKVKKFSIIGLLYKKFTVYSSHSTEFITSAAADMIFLEINCQDRFDRIEMVELNQFPTIIINSNFEQSLNGWYHSGINTWELEEKLINQDSHGKHLRLYMYEYIFQNIKLKPNTSYKFIIWKRAQNRMEAKVGIYCNKELLKETENLADKPDTDFFDTNRELNAYGINTLHFNSSENESYELRISTRRPGAKTMGFQVYLIDIFEENNNLSHTKCFTL
ncbi:hypothetical protein [Bacillus mycoides]